MIAGHAPLIAADLERFLLKIPGRHLIHSFGLWGFIGVAVSRKLRRKGIEAIPIVNSYTTYENEALGKIEGISHSSAYLQQARYQAQFLWVKLVVGRYERQAYQQSCLVLINYESVRELVRAKYGSNVNFRKMPYTSEAAFLRDVFEAPAAAPDAIANFTSSGVPLIVAVSRHDPRKGVDILLRALGELRVAGVPFRACLVSGGPMLQANRRLAARLGLEDVTALLGWVPDPHLYLRHAHVFVLPSLQEGSGSLSLIEALQVGIPVVASKIDGIPEDVTDSDSALLVDAGEVAKLRDALSHILTNGALRQHLAHRARETFLHKFSPETFTSALRATYAELGF
jgi:glycosyltransferase involved in cell wall biosynthesis